MSQRANSPIVLRLSHVGGEGDGYDLNKGLLIVICYATWIGILGPHVVIDLHNQEACLECE